MSAALSGPALPASPPPARPDEDAARAALEATVALSLRVLQAAMVVLALLFLGSGLFTVEPHEVALIRRLGKVEGSPETRELEPGAHWAWPVLDEVIRVPARRVERITTDAFALALRDDEAVTGRLRERKNGLDPEKDGGYFLPGDANILHASLAVRYQIARAYDLATTTTDGEALTRVLLARAAARAAAASPIDDLLTTRKEAFLESVRLEAQRSLDKLGCGIKLLGVELARDLTPPPQVREAFASVAKALQDRDRLQSEAQAIAAETRGRASSDAKRIREESHSQARALVGDLVADASVLEALLPEWRRDRAHLESRLLAEALARVRPEETFLVRPGDGLRIRRERDTKQQREEMFRRARGDAAPPEGGSK